MSEFKLGKKTMKLVDYLRIENKLSNNSEVIRKSLYVLGVLTQADNDGKEIFIRDKDDNEQKVILI